MNKLKNILIYPFKMAIQEIKKDKKLQEELKHQDLKTANISPFMYASYMFLSIISIMYIAVLYLIIAGIFVDPVGFIPLLPTIFTTWVFTLIYTKVYPKTKENFLKSIGFNKKMKNVKEK
ncbi:hypothetical protein GCM10028868_03030 [Virgibacillus kimchii]